MQKYTLGFIFTPSFDKVLLIHKLKPAWQKGKINGIGGKIELNESARTCIVREVKEESALYIKEDAWIHIGKSSSVEWVTELFTCIYRGDIQNAKSVEDEKIEWFRTNDLPKNMISNLHWLIPLAIDKLANGTPNTVDISY